MEGEGAGRRLRDWNRDQFVERMEMASSSSHSRAVRMATNASHI